MLGVTAKFRLKYIDIIETRFQLKFIIYANNFSLKLLVWEIFLPLCYATDKVHYARYGTYYIQHLRQLKKSHLGSLDKIRSFMSIRRNEIGIRQETNLAGEQI